MCRLHLVVQYFKVRAQHQPGLACQGDAVQALAHGGIVCPRGDAGVGVDHGMRLAAGQHQRFHRTFGTGGVVGGVHLLFQHRRMGEQYSARACAGAGALQIQHRALQVVLAARSYQGLRIVRALAQPGMHQVGHLVARARCGNAQVLQHGALAQVQVYMQVLRHAALALRGFAVVGFDEYAAHAIGHVHHQQRGLHGAACLVVQVQPYRFTGAFFGHRSDTQAQALATQGTVRPGKRGGVAVAGLDQAVKKLCALLRVAGIEPAGCNAALQRVAHGVQRPACAGEGRGIATCRVGLCAVSQPGVRWGGWQMAKGFVACGNPAAHGQVFPGS